ncbi:MAG: alpha/beta hydrolase [Anaerolineae bacterium]|nr:alpha/beta hydrolase [Anaerolineae bacterium]
MAEHVVHRVLTGRLLMNVREWPGAGPPVVFLHSFTGNSLLALRLGNTLAGHRRLLAPDLRGRGLTDAPFGDYGLPVHMHSVIACLDRLGVGRFIAAGHSFGGHISLYLAAAYPERVVGLLLFDGGVVAGPLAAQMLAAYYDNLHYRYPSVDAYVERFKASPLYQPWTDELDALVRSNLYQQPDGTYIRAVARYVVEAERRPENMAHWARIPDQYPLVRCPTLIVRAGKGIVGDFDQVIPDEQLAAVLAAIPGSRAVTVPEAGHTSLMTIPSAARDEAVLSFLEAIPKD